MNTLFLKLLLVVALGIVNDVQLSEHFGGIFRFNFPMNTKGNTWLVFFLN